MRRPIVYVISSLKNDSVPVMAKKLRDAGFTVIDEWFAPGPEADDWWTRYEKARGNNFVQALDSLHVEHVFNFDRRWLESSDAVVLLLPCGKSGHLEFGYAVGRGKKGVIVLDKEPERYDIMYRYADKVCYSMDEAVEFLRAIFV